MPRLRPLLGRAVGGGQQKQPLFAGQRMLSWIQVEQRRGLWLARNRRNVAAFYSLPADKSIWNYPLTKRPSPHLAYSQFDLYISVLSAALRTFPARSQMLAEGSAAGAPKSQVAALESRYTCPMRDCCAQNQRFLLCNRQ